MNKNVRQNKIIELIQNNEIETQEELASILNASGISAAQATVSRDIRELGLQKRISGKKSIYFYPQERAVNQEKYLHVLRAGFVKADQAGTFVVIRTVSGMAMAVAAALDSLQLKELVGSIAGDDTIMCATKSDADAKNMTDYISSLI